MPERAFFVGKAMKRIFTFAVVMASSAYYACLPILMARADEASVTTPAVTTSTVSAVLYMRVTAYASVPDETDSTPFITANGTHVHDGIAASNILPFGTKIEIPALFGNKIFTIEDRMSQKIKNTIDIWMTTPEKAIVFGMSHANIVVLGNETSTNPTQTSTAALDKSLSLR